MSLEHIDPYPRFLNKKLDLVVNEQIAHTRITATEWTDHWRPFLAKLYDVWVAHYPQRYLIAVAGPPGAGKSVFAEQLFWIIDRGFFHKDAHAIALPMDGFHFPNAVLSTHTRKLQDGTEIPLIKVKGQPDTIDVARLKRYLAAIVQRPAAPHVVSWPGYSRTAHDVVPDKHPVPFATNIVIIEGNYLLVDRGIFQGTPDFFNLKIYIESPAPKIIANLVERHIEGGRDLEEAKDWVKRIDLPNARIAEATKPNADVVVERDADNFLAAVTWKDQGVATGGEGDEKRSAGGAAAETNLSSSPGEDAPGAAAAQA